MDADWERTSKKARSGIELKSSDIGERSDTEPKQHFFVVIFHQMRRQEYFGKTKLTRY